MAARWRIKQDEEREADEDGTFGIVTGLVVTAPNGMQFESHHSMDAVTAVVRALERDGVLAVGCDPILPSDWPSLVLTPALMGPCRRCRERLPAEAFSLKPNGLELSGTCDECCRSDGRRNAKVRTCPQCGHDRPDLRMRGGKVGCPKCLTVAPVTKPAPAAFDVDQSCREARESAGLAHSDAPRVAARNDLPRSIVLDGGRLL